MKHYQKNRQKGILLSFISLVLLGTLPVISNSRPTETSALNFALFLSIWQLIFATPALFAEYRLGNRGIFHTHLNRKRKCKTIGIILLTGSLFGLSTFAYVLSMEKAGTVSASIAIQAYPLFSILWESIFLKRHKSYSELFFTLLLITGLYYMATKGSWAIEGISYWFVFSLSVPFIWSVAHVIIKEVLEKTPITPIQVTFFRVLVSSLIILAISISAEGVVGISDLLHNQTFQYYAAAMGLVYFVELVNWFYAVRHVDVSVASSITTPWPAVTMVLAIIFLHESIALYHLVGLTAIITGVYGLLFAGKKREAKRVTLNYPDKKAV